MTQLLQTSTNRIRLAHKPVGAGLRLFTPGHAIHAWAQQLLGRYLGRPLPNSPFAVNRVFRDPATAVAQQTVFQQTHIAPHLRLTLVSHSFSQPVSGQDAGVPVPQWQIKRPSTGQLVEMWVRRLQTQTENRVTTTRQLLTRLEQRTERIETVTTPGHAGRVRAEAASDTLPTARSPLVVPETFRPARPVPRIVHRPTAVATPAPSDGPPRPNNGWEKLTFAPTTAVSSSKTAESHTVDINRLTEQVVQNLDRRLLAYRERTGRT